jgi:hypothetical protein
MKEVKRNTNYEKNKIFHGARVEETGLLMFMHKKQVSDGCHS